MRDTATEELRSLSAKISRGREGEERGKENGREGGWAREGLRGSGRTVVVRLARLHRVIDTVMVNAVSASTSYSISASIVRRRSTRSSRCYRRRHRCRRCSGGGGAANELTPTLSREREREVGGRGRKGAAESEPRPRKRGITDGARRDGFIFDFDQSGPVKGRDLQQGPPGQVPSVGLHHCENRGKNRGRKTLAPNVSRRGRTVLLSTPFLKRKPRDRD